jgi:hypothetical protein
MWKSIFVSHSFVDLTHIGEFIIKQLQIWRLVTSKIVHIKTVDELCKDG